MTDSIKQNRIHILGVAGGSGSGKTYFARGLKQLLTDQCEILYQDNFYFDQSQRFDFDGGSVNFDHPDSIDFSLLAQCLKQLKSGQAADIPIYDFTSHKRKSETLRFQPKPIVIVDGILIFHSEPVRQLLDDLIYFDAPEDLRFQRRLDRDVQERGRTPEGVRQQFFLQVKPMHDQYVEPSKIYAKTVVKDLGDYKNILETYHKKLKSK